MPPSERKIYIRNILRKILCLNSNGLTIREIAENTSFDSRTIQKHLSILKRTNEVYTKKIGPTALYYSNCEHVSELLNEPYKTNESMFLIKELENSEGHYISIQEKNDKEINRGILIPYNDFDNFIKYLDKILYHINSK